MMYNIYCHSCFNPPIAQNTLWVKDKVSSGDIPARLFTQDIVVPAVNQKVNPTCKRFKSNLEIS